MGHRETSRERSIVMRYIPKQGDIIFLNFDPQTGHEQAGHRPALVISNNDFNTFMQSGTIVCPITNTDRDYPFHVKLPKGMKTTGVVMCDQIKSLDISSRHAYFHDEAPNEVLHEVLEKIKLFF